jgi:hypothetical protein
MKHLILTFLLGATALSAADKFRTDINPALIYHQGLLMVPQLSDEDRKHVFQTDWRSRALDERCTDLVTSYRNVFKMLRRAAASEVVCDWGIDMSDGPATLLPGLARFKSIAQVVGLRARIHFAEGKQEAAREELLATLAMAHNISKDGTLISVMVQVAMEGLVASFIAENFYQFTPETLEELASRLNAGPPHGSVQQSMAVEKSSFYEWLIQRITQIEAEAGGNQQQVQAKVRELWKNHFSESESDKQADKIVDEWIRASDGSAAGLIAYVKQLEPFYEEITDIAGLPWSEYQTRYPEFEKKTRAHSNVLARDFFSAIGNCRKKEFTIQSWLAMLQAAIAYKLHGDSAFNSIADPFGDGPFAFRRFTLEGVDRGFELQSRLNTKGFPEKLIIIEKAGPAVHVNGKTAGEKIP